MVVLDVEVADFAAAASQLRHEVAENLQLCLEGLRLHGGLVGVDPAGVSWAAGYDPAVRAAVTATARVADAAYKTAAMLAASGRNYDHAEAASVTGGASPEVDWAPLLVDPPAVPVPHVPSAGGAGAKTPAGWWLIAHTIGYVWPGGHQDELRETAAAWRSAAGGLDLAVPVPLGILGRFAADRIPEYDGIAAVMQQLYRRLGQLADTYRALADSCEQYADHLDDCHREVEHELTELAVESAALQTGGAVLAAFTFGVAEVPTQAAQAARIAATAGRVGVLIEHLTTAARRLVHTIRTVQAVAHDITDSLRALTQTRIALAVVEQVPKLERLTTIGRDAEKSAVAARDATRAADAAKLPTKLRGRQPGDPGVWGDTSTLPEHFGNHGAEVGALSEQDYVRAASDFLQRCIHERLPRKIDGDGNIRVFDPKTGLFGSYRGDGSARTFFRPTSKTYFDRQPGALR